MIILVHKYLSLGHFWRDVVGYKAGAGFVVCRKFKDGIRYLGLKGPKYLRESSSILNKLVKESFKIFFLYNYTPSNILT